MVFRQKLLTAKNSNQPAVLVRYAKRHQVQVKKLIYSQLTQHSFGEARFRAHGEFLLYSQGAGRMLPNHIEATRRILLRSLKRLFRIWMCLRFTGMVTAKPKEVRMGKGKGNFLFWSRVVEIGTPIFELSLVRYYPPEFLYHLFVRCRAKFTVRTGLISRFCGFNSKSRIA
jgi:ribosomal protein L16